MRETRLVDGSPSASLKVPRGVMSRVRRLVSPLGAARAGVKRGRMARMAVVVGFMLVSESECRRVEGCSGNGRLVVVMI